MTTFTGFIPSVGTTSRSAASEQQQAVREMPRLYAQVPLQQYTTSLPDNSMLHAIGPLGTVHYAAAMKFSKRVWCCKTCRLSNGVDVRH